MKEVLCTKILDTNDIGNVVWKCSLIGLSRIGMVVLSLIIVHNILENLKLAGVYRPFLSIPGLEVTDDLGILVVEGCILYTLALTS
jgi:hypothetical protein